MKRQVERPSMRAMPPPLRAAVEFAARRLKGDSHDAWLVGGAVRDLALGVEPHDADLATDAHPDEIEALFTHTVAVGKRFGTILVHVDGIEVQVTTFRAEGGYSDARRPDEVRFGTSLEEDARRRDFTCNALYLDPSTDEMADPEGGLEDLGAGILRAVGDPASRFAEDGLRLLRMARFAAAIGLTVEAKTLSAARANADALRGVSPERVRSELEWIAAGAAPATALALLAETGLWSRILPPPPAGTEEAVRAVERLGPRPGFVPLLGVLLGPGDERGVPTALAHLKALRTSRVQERETAELWSRGYELERLLEAGADVRRSERIRLVREEGWPAALRVWRARFPAACGHERELEELLNFALSVPESERFPTPLLASTDLERMGIPRGPRWSALLREAEDLQLDGVHSTREQALAWLRERAG